MGDSGKRKWKGDQGSRGGRGGKRYRPDYDPKSRRDRGPVQGDLPKGDLPKGDLPKGDGRQAQHDRPSVLPEAFAKDEIEAEDRKPKRKVAVLIGYSGTGYRGMQISPTEKTIEGELFTAFVKAGAISKANADEPRKSSLVRCARTDKGVHAAGNMISLKLIVEDADIVDRINAQLPAQIRVWGIERTTGSFSCYQSCDSRWYEYLIPTNALLPPHPSSYLATKIADASAEVGDEDELARRQADVKGFWEKVDEEHIKPLLDSLDAPVRDAVEKAIHRKWDGTSSSDGDAWIRSVADIGYDAPKPSQKNHAKQSEEDEVAPDEPDLQSDADADSPAAGDTTDGPGPRPSEVTAAIRAVRAAYEAARRAYRVSPPRIAALQSALSAYVGTRNFHNYTIQKTFGDASAKRNILSFVAGPAPLVINGTEWLSLKVHGQSFMMHQIRKMVGMAALLVRCGADAGARIEQSFGKERFSIPKVPGLGLLLERPVFESYNKVLAQRYDRPQLGFGKHEAAIEAFKREHIYGRIWEEEARGNTFHQFFNHIDNYAQPHFLFLTSKGLAATKREDPAPGEGAQGGSEAVGDGAAAAAAAAAAE